MSENDTTNAGVVKPGQRTYGLMSPSGELVLHTASHPQAVFDFFALIGIFQPEAVHIEQQRMLGTGWKLCIVELKPVQEFSVGEAWAILDQFAGSAPVVDGAEQLITGIPGFPAPGEAGADYGRQLLAHKLAQQTETEHAEYCAKAIYDTLPYDGPTGSSKPEWVPGGNSTKQQEARRMALWDDGVFRPVPEWSVPGPVFDFMVAMSDEEMAKRGLEPRHEPRPANRYPMGAGNEGDPDTVAAAEGVRPGDEPESVAAADGKPAETATDHKGNAEA